MAFFTDPSSKLERALRQLLIQQGKAVGGGYGATDCYIGHYSGIRAFPSRSVIVPSFSPDRGYRPEGVCKIQIEHTFDAAEQPGEDYDSARAGMDEYVGKTLDTLVMAGSNTEGAMTVLADAITSAGRWLAIDDPTDPDSAAIVAKNSDMANFRCDWIRFDVPFIERGKLPAENPVFVVYLNMTAFVSHSAI